MRPECFTRQEHKEERKSGIINWKWKVYLLVKPVIECGKRSETEINTKRHSRKKVNKWLQLVGKSIETCHRLGLDELGARIIGYGWIIRIHRASCVPIGLRAIGIKKRIINLIMVVTTIKMTDHTRHAYYLGSRKNSGWTKLGFSASCWREASWATSSLRMVCNWVP